MRIRIVAMAAAFCAVLASCGPQGKSTVGKTVAGASTQLSQWQHIPPAGLLFDLGDLGNIGNIGRSERRIRDNHIVQHRAYFDGSGYMWVEHLTAANSVFSLRTTARYNKADWTLEAARRYFAERKEKVTVGEKRHIHEYGKRGGWVVSVSNEQGSRTCLFARLGFLNDSSRTRTSGEHYDTGVYFLDCSGRRSLDDTAAFLKELKLVS